MVYFIVAIILLFLIKFIYDKYLLQESIQKQGGIFEKYKILTTWISSSPNPIINEFKDHLIIKTLTPSITTTFEITPGFNKLIVEMIMDYKNLGNINNKWEFDENKYTQQDMINAIRTYMVGAQERLHENISIKKVEIEASEEDSNQNNINDILSKFPHLQIKEKIDVALKLYTIATDENKASILNIWYKSNHDYEYFDELSANLNSAEPKIFFKPTNHNFENDYNYILESIKNTKGYIGIEDTFLEYLRATKEEFEIDRFLYIVSAIEYDNISQDLSNLSNKNWLKCGSIPIHYEFILYKTTIEIIMVKGDYKVLMDNVVKVYKNLESQNRLYWFKYQFTRLLLRFFENGHKLENLSESELVEKKENYSLEAEMEDRYFNI